MANYNIDDYTIEFSSDYKTLLVYDDTASLEASYPLDTAGQSVSLTVVDGEYVVTVAGDFDLGIHAIDVGAGDSLNISSTTMAGIGIVDLRDANRVSAFNGDYDLTCTTFKLKYVSGPFSLQIFFSNASCFTVE